MLKMEEWIVLFVFAELVALGALIVVSCWCCRRSLQRARNEEVAHDLPVTRVVAGATARPKTTTATTQSSSSQSRATDVSDESVAGDRHTNSHESQDEDLASGGIWGFIAGVSPRGPRRPTRSPAPAPATTTTTTTTTASTSHSSHASRGDTVEVVNISVNVAADDDRDDDKLASEGRKSGSAA